MSAHNEQIVQEIRNHYNEFIKVSDRLITLMKNNWQTRQDHLADKDLLMMVDTITAIEYLRSRIMRERKLVLSDAVQGFTRSMEQAYLSWEKLRTAKEGTMPLIPIVEVEDLFEESDRVVYFAVAEFNPDNYGKVGFFSKFRGALRGSEA